MLKINKKDHYYLIDGSGYIFRAYYALPPLTRKSDGLPVGAVSGFCNMLFKLLEDAKSVDNKERPTHFAVIFDSARKNFRNEIYSDYKANRSDAPEDLIPQFDFIRKSVLAFSLPSVEQLNYEADDLIATYVEKIIKVGAKATIVSSDKDLLQLHGKNTRIFDPMKNIIVDANGVKEKFGVTPDKVIDVQSLAGDTSDNVPGVPGIGVKTAAQLINEYGSLEGLLSRVEEIKQPKRRESLIEHAEMARISYKLVSLATDAPVPVPLETFIKHDPDLPHLKAFLQKQGFNNPKKMYFSFTDASSGDGGQMGPHHGYLFIKRASGQITKISIHELLHGFGFAMPCTKGVRDGAHLGVRWVLAGWISHADGAISSPAGAGSVVYPSAHDGAASE